MPVLFLLRRMRAIDRVKRSRTRAVVVAAAAAHRYHDEKTNVREYRDT